MIRADFHRPDGARGYGDHADVDIEAEHLIRLRLQTAFPEWGYRGEETGSSPMDPPPRFIWLVDPNDGTRSYLKGYRGSSVSIGLLRDRQPILGVVYAPSAPDDDGDLMTWAEGCGPLTRNGRPVAREPWPESLGPYDEALISQESENSPRAYLECLRPARYRAMNSIAYRLALAAAGDGAVGMSAHGAGDWDYAAGHALLRGVGGDLFHGENRPAVYSARGESHGRCCFGGAESAVQPLFHRPWSQTFAREPTDPREPAALQRRGPAPGAAIADPALLRRAQGCLLGQLIGDSLGSTVEFQAPAAIRRAFPDGVRDLVDGGTWDTLAGQPTDDSEMALVLARTLISAGGYDPEGVARAYAYWFQSGPFDCGSTTAQALGAIPSLNGLRRSDDAIRAAAAAMAAANRGSQANGSLMRISPLGVWGHTQDPNVLADVARAESALTHPNEVCRDACALFVVSLAHAVGEAGTGLSVYHFAREWAAHAQLEPTVMEALEAAERTAPPDFMINQGWVLIALQNAFYRLLHAPTLEDGMIETVMAGGDTDTNAAIAGALLGAVHGRDALPWRWRRRVLSCRPLAGATGVRRPRPEPFWPVDAMELAERLLLAGRR